MIARRIKSTNSQNLTLSNGIENVLIEDVSTVSPVAPLNIEADSPLFPRRTVATIRRWVGRGTATKFMSGDVADFGGTIQESTWNGRPV